MSDEFQQLAEALSPRYRLERLIDHGLAAQVYLAEDTLRARPVAVKILRPEMLASVNADRFMAEINVSAQLPHPNIVRVYESGEVDGRPYYVMPYIEGESLRARLSRVKRLSIAEALRITEDIARALEFAHRRKIVHRDIKPENVMLRGERAIVLDFGIALALEASFPRRTSPGLTLGTVEYMSPEQVVGESGIDGRSDIYSLACVTYEMLCGRPPFMGTAIAVMNRHVTAEPRMLAAMCPDVPRPVIDVLVRALSKFPEQRFATASDFVVALRRAVPDARSKGPRIAVLSFVHAHGAATVDWFSDRITEEVIYALTDTRQFEVSARSAVPFGGTKLHVSNLARELDADMLLFATVRQTSGAVQLAATLLRATNGSQLRSWAFTGREREGVSVVSELATQVANAVSCVLVSAPAPKPGLMAATG
jgi:serine/threonine-protein kinase